MKIPTRTHPNCRNNDCSICFNDHEKLNDYFKYKTGIKGVDWLNKYRNWLDNNDIPAETYGWASIEAFDMENISNFLKEYV